MIIFFTRKTTSETNKCAIASEQILYISATKESTTIHLTHGCWVVVTEDYEKVLTSWNIANQFQ